MAPHWLTILAWIGLALGFASALWIAADIYLLRYRQQMPVMKAVWPVTALCFGPVAVAAYYRWGRPKSHRWQREHGDFPEKPGLRRDRGRRLPLQAARSAT